MNSAPTDYVTTVDSSMIFIVGVSLVFFIGIVVTMIFFVIKFNRKKGHKPVDIHGSLLLETVWFVIPLVLVITMFYYGFRGYSDFRTIPENAFEVDVVGRMWDWDFNYKNGRKTDSLYVAVDVPVKLNLVSADVNHSFFIPAFRIKQDVINGSMHTLVFTPRKVGKYNVACAEYCGLNHSKMYTKIIVMSKKEFNDWYSNNKEKNEITSTNIEL